MKTVTLKFGFVLWFALLGLSNGASAVDLTNPDPLIAQFAIGLDSLFASSPNVVTATTVGQYFECGKATPGMGVYLDVVYVRQNGKFEAQQVNDKGSFTCKTTGPRGKNFYAKVIAVDQNNKLVSAGDLSLSLEGVVPLGSYAFVDRNTRKVKVCWIPSAIGGCDINTQY